MIFNVCNLATFHQKTYFVKNSHSLLIYIYIFSYAREQDMRGLSDALPKIPETNFSLNFQWYPPSVNAYSKEAKALSSNLIYTLKAIKSVFMVCHLLCIHTIGAFFSLPYHSLQIAFTTTFFLLYFSAFKSCYFSQPWFEIFLITDRCLHCDLKIEANPNRLIIWTKATKQNNF
jgi:hypothetical protein